MTTVSIPLPPELAQFVEQETKATGLSKADVVRQAIKWYAEELAVRDVLISQQEHREGRLLRGDIDDILA